MPIPLAQLPGPPCQPEDYEKQRTHEQLALAQEPQPTHVTTLRAKKLRKKLNPEALRAVYPDVVVNAVDPEDRTQCTRNSAKN